MSSIDDSAGSDYADSIPARKIFSARGQAEFQKFCIVKIHAFTQISLALGKFPVLLDVRFRSVETGRNLRFQGTPDIPQRVPPKIAVFP